MLIESANTSDHTGDGGESEGDEKLEVSGANVFSHLDDEPQYQHKGKRLEFFCSQNWFGEIGGMLQNPKTRLIQRYLNGSKYFWKRNVRLNTADEANETCDVTNLITPPPYFVPPGW